MRNSSPDALLRHQCLYHSRPDFPLQGPGGKVLDVFLHYKSMGYIQALDHFLKLTG